MRKLREILRLYFDVHLSQRAIARAQGIDHVTVADVLRRFAEAGLSWPLPADLTDAALERRLYPGNAGRPKQRPEPDWATVHAELRRKGVTLQLLWQEYREQCPDGYGYSLFCERYRRYRQTVDFVLRKVYRPGEFCFVDYAGDTVPVIHPRTGEIQRAHVFVAILAYSNYTFLDLHPQETTGWWIRGHQDAFAAFGGVPRIVVPDNPRPLVTRAERFDVTLNRSYQEFATHYGVAVIPARPRRPRDKGKVEAAVLLTERWVLAALRHTRLVGWEAAWERVKQLQDRLNQRPFQKWPGCRAALWAAEERAALRPLPAQPYEYALWRVAKVGRDYHIEVDRAYYSVPYRYVGRVVEVRITTALVECFHAGTRIASHPRNPQQRWHTLREHMPPHHQAVVDGWNPDTWRRRAAAIGPQTARLIETILTRAVIPQQVFRRCQGIVALAHQYPTAVLEAAAERALQAETLSYRAIKDLCAWIQSHPAPRPSGPTHANVRGAAYYTPPAEASSAAGPRADDLANPDQNH